MDKIFKLILEKLELLLFIKKMKIIRKTTVEKDVFFAFSNRKWPQQKQFSPTFRKIVFGEAKAL
jgi:hypothetical protein